MESRSYAWGSDEHPEFLNNKIAQYVLAPPVFIILGYILSFPIEWFLSGYFELNFQYIGEAQIFFYRWIACPSLLLIPWLFSLAVRPFMPKDWHPIDLEGPYRAIFHPDGTLALYRHFSKPKLYDWRDIGEIKHEPVPNKSKQEKGQPPDFQMRIVWRDGKGFRRLHGKAEEAISAMRVVQLQDCLNAMKKAARTKATQPSDDDLGI